MKIKCTVKRAFCFFVTAVLLLSLLTVPASAQGNVVLKLAGRYSEQNRVLTVELWLRNVDTPVSSGMFALSYDKNKLCLVSDEKATVADNSAGPKAAEGINASLCGSDTQRGYTWIDWYAQSTIKASQIEHLIATVYFKLDNSVNYTALSEASIMPCMDTDFLNQLAGYGAEGGALVCHGDKAYSLRSGDITVSYDYLSDQQPVDATGREIRFLEVTELSVPVGKAPTLPMSIKVLYADGTGGNALVQWDEVATKSYASDCVFTVYGTVEGCVSRAKCTVIVGKGETESIENDGSSAIKAENTDKVSVAGNAVLTEKFDIVQVNPGDPLLDEYRRYIGDGYSIIAFKMTPRDGDRIAQTGERYNITLKVGRKFNGQTWTLLQPVNGEMTKTDYTVEDEKVTITVSDIVLIVFRVPGTEKVDVLADDSGLDSWFKGKRLVAVIITLLLVLVAVAFYYKEKLLNLLGINKASEEKKEEAKSDFENQEEEGDTDKTEEASEDEKEPEE